jgi:hypothetical protein
MKNFSRKNTGHCQTGRAFLSQYDRQHCLRQELFPQEMKAWLTKTGFKNIGTKVLGDTVVLTARKGWYEQVRRFIIENCVSRNARKERTDLYLTARG